MIENGISDQLPVLRGGMTDILKHYTTITAGEECLEAL
jgi:hypothetical protein